MKVLPFLRHYPLTLLCVATVCVLSLYPVPETPLSHVIGIDKVAHILMYGGLSLLLWWEYLRAHPASPCRRAIPWTMLLPIAMSGLLELLQEYATDCRSGDWYDFVANTLGVLTAAGVAALVRAWFGRSARTPKSRT